jgi:type II secretory pathway pseudopilin PulG
MMRRSFIIRTQGFTLLEVLVYLAILIIVSTVAVSLLVSLDDVIDRYRVDTALYRSGTNVMEQVVVELRRGDEFNVASSVLNTSATGTIAIDNGATTTIISRVGDEMRLTINGEEYGNLLQDPVIVTGFTVYKYDTTSGTFVRVKLELSATIESVTKTIDLYGGAVIRGDI